MEYKDDFGVNEEQQEGRTPGVGVGTSGQMPVRPLEPASITPTGTGCRTCVIFVLLLGVILGFVYFYYQDKLENQSLPSGVQPGQSQQK